MKEYKGLHFDYKFIFIHVPKTAGKSINRSLMKKMGKSGFFQTFLRLCNRQVGGHIPANFYKINFPNEFESFFKFTFVRNPWERICSAFFYVHERPPELEAGRYDDMIVRYGKEDFESFIKDGLLHYWLLPHFRPQTFWVLDENGENDLDFIGKYENLNADFDFICQKIGLEGGGLGHYGECDSRSNGRLPYEEYYDQEMIDTVAKFYRHDIELFDYDFR